MLRLSGSDQPLGHRACGRLKIKGHALAFLDGAGSPHRGPNGSDDSQNGERDDSRADIHAEHLLGIIPA